MCIRLWPSTEVQRRIMYTSINVSCWKSLVSNCCTGWLCIMFVIKTTINICWKQNIFTQDLVKLLILAEAVEIQYKAKERKWESEINVVSSHDRAEKEVYRVQMWREKNSKSKFGEQLIYNYLNILWMKKRSRCFISDTLLYWFDILGDNSFIYSQSSNLVSCGVHQLQLVAVWISTNAIEFRESFYQMRLIITFLCPVNEDDLERSPYRWCLKVIVRLLLHPAPEHTYVQLLWDQLPQVRQLVPIMIIILNTGKKEMVF